MIYGILQNLLGISKGCFNYNKEVEEQGRRGVHTVNLTNFGHQQIMRVLEIYDFFFAETKSFSPIFKKNPEQKVSFIYL